MNNINELFGYMKRLKKVVTEQAVATIFNKAVIRKMQVDDLLVCFLAKLPDSYKSALKRRMQNMNDLKSITAFNRLSKVIKAPFFISKSLYFVNYGEVMTLINTVLANLERDIATLEET